MTEELDGRCHVYPSRPAPAACSVCSGSGFGRSVCGVVVAAPEGPEVVTGLALQKSVIRAALASSGTMLLLSLGVADYIEASNGLGYLLPFLMGLAVGSASRHISLPVRGVVPLLVAAVYAAVGVGYAFMINKQPYGDVGDWLPPLLAALAGVPASILVDPIAPPPGVEPRPRKRRARP